MSGSEVSLQLLSDGTMKFDGGALFGQVPKLLWERKVRSDRRNRVTLGLNCLLIQHGGKWVLVDTGVGSKEPAGTKDMYGLAAGRLSRRLRQHGLSLRDIDLVVLTHLHFDHAGGCTKLDRTGQAMPTFPKATYVVQRSSWEHAQSPNERSRASFHLDDYVPLQEQLALLDGDTELLPGLWVRVTNGHSQGHQLVTVEVGGGKAAFLGDLVPTHHHLALPFIPAFDQHPEETLEQKRELLAQAEREGWLVIFAHGHETRAGYLEQRNHRMALRPVEL